MTKEEYIDELRLIKEQNDVEYEIYPMAVEIIQPTLKNLSKRYVFARRKTHKGQIYYGLSSFPDVAILDKNFRSTPNTKLERKDWDSLKGCLEVKALGNKLYSKEEIQNALSSETLTKDMGQLIGEILWYKKVIYTNGIEWRFLYVSEYSDKLRTKIVDTANKRIQFEEKKSEQEYNWWRDMKKDDSFEIKDELITDDCTENWEDFIEKITSIRWD